MEAMQFDQTRDISKLTSEETEKSNVNTFFFFFLCCINLFWVSKLQQDNHNSEYILI